MRCSPAGDEAPLEEMAPPVYGLKGHFDSCGREKGAKQGIKAGGGESIWRLSKGSGKNRYKSDHGNRDEERERFQEVTFGLEDFCSLPGEGRAPHFLWAST